MNGYFDALMRSSGMNIDRRAAATTQDEGGRQVASQAEPTLVQVNAEGRSQAVESTTAGAAAPQQRAPVSRPSMDADPHLLRVADTRDHQTAAPDVDVADTQTPGVNDVTTTSGMTRPVRPLEASPVRGDELIRAAMRWVAADTHVSAVAQPGALSLPTIDVGEISSDAPRNEPAIALVTPRDDEDDAEAPPTNAIVATPTGPMVATPERAVPTRRSMHVPDQARVPSITTAPAPREDVVEVSIGAIHVRVDAPAAQTVVSPAATPFGPPVGHTPPARSALSRRALRRI